MWLHSTGRVVSHLHVMFARATIIESSTLGRAQASAERRNGRSSEPFTQALPLLSTTESRPSTPSQRLQAGPLSP